MRRCVVVLASHILKDLLTDELFTGVNLSVAVEIQVHLLHLHRGFLLSTLPSTFPPL